MYIIMTLYNVSPIIIIVVKGEFPPDVEKEVVTALIDSNTDIQAV